LTYFNPSKHSYVACALILKMPAFFFEIAVLVLILSSEYNAIILLNITDQLGI
jgi:hypothetical protein